MKRKAINNRVVSIKKKTKTYTCNRGKRNTTAVAKTLLPSQKTS
jgi:hypothetical protein